MEYVDKASVLCYTSPKLQLGASDIIKIKAEKAFQAFSETHSGSTGRVKMTPRHLFHVDAVNYRLYKPKKLHQLGLWSLGNN